eukprot:TRINITY_DN8050_c0_g2_i1.p1 TRINITY_DN8050_c0_g2~~TRINITY_DN8050_c0_g2_i1.p1  ORF type:complete len:484 (-),score=109.42 TRINITY_DN8050_c0_g2_i1:48-1322(-)
MDLVGLLPHQGTYMASAFKQPDGTSVLVTIYSYCVRATVIDGNLVSQVNDSLELGTIRKTIRKASKMNCAAIDGRCYAWCDQTVAFLAEIKNFDRSDQMTDVTPFHSPDGKSYLSDVVVSTDLGVIACTSEPSQRVFVWKMEESKSCLQDIDISDMWPQDFERSQLNAIIRIREGYLIVMSNYGRICIWKWDGFKFNPFRRYEDTSFARFVQEPADVVVSTDLGVIACTSEPSQRVFVWKMEESKSCLQDIDISDMWPQDFERSQLNAIIRIREGYLIVMSNYGRICIWKWDGFKFNPFRRYEDTSFARFVQEFEDSSAFMRFSLSFDLRMGLLISLNAEGSAINVWDLARGGLDVPVCVYINSDDDELDFPPRVEDVGDLAERRICWSPDGSCFFLSGPLARLDRWKVRWHTRNMYGCKLPES